MKFTSLITFWLIGILVTGLIVINVLDLIDVLRGGKPYPFGSEFFSSYSIYHSKETYILYNVVFILVLGSTLIVAIKKKWTAFCVLLVIDILLFIYPSITNE